MLRNNCASFRDRNEAVDHNQEIQLEDKKILNHIRKYQKELMKDLKPVYGAVTKETGEKALDKLEEKWGEQYPIVIKSWRDNWDRLSEFFQYSEAIRKLIYTTNTVEGYHR